MAARLKNHPEVREQVLASQLSRGVVGQIGCVIFLGQLLPVQCPGRAYVAGFQLERVRWWRGQQWIQSPPDTGRAAEQVVNHDTFERKYSCWHLNNLRGPTAVAFDRSWRWRWWRYYRKIASTPEPECCKCSVSGHLAYLFCIWLFSCAIAIIACDPNRIREFSYACETSAAIRAAFCWISAFCWSGVGCVMRSLPLQMHEDPSSLHRVAGGQKTPMVVARDLGLPASA